jgi:hypothetical protein
MEQEAKIKHECWKILSTAESFGLEVEVVTSAFKHKEEFHTASLLECLQVGADEWDISI